MRTYTLGNREHFDERLKSAGLRNVPFYRLGPYTQEGGIGQKPKYFPGAMVFPTYSDAMNWRLAHASFKHACYELDGHFDEITAYGNEAGTARLTKDIAVLHRMTLLRAFANFIMDKCEWVCEHAGRKIT